MKKKSGYHEIYETLLERIRDGTYPPGSKLPPERFLQEEWDVERTTVRRALALLAQEHHIEKRAGFGSVVRGEGTQEQPEVPVRVGSHPLLAMVVSTGIRARYTQINHHFISPVYSAFAVACLKNGYQSFNLVTPSESRDEKIFALLENCAGVIWADNVHPDLLRAAKKQKIPSVLMSQLHPGFRSVLCDNEDGLRQAVTFLHQQGHRNIAFLGGDQVFYNSLARISAFRHTMFDLGLDVPDRRILPCGWGKGKNMDDIRDFLKQNPDVTAICTVNDTTADAVMEAAREIGRRVPEDLSVIGFGDMEIAPLLPVPLTTIRIRTGQFGKELLYALQQEMRAPWQSPVTIRIGAELVLRKSVAEAPRR